MDIDFGSVLWGGFFAALTAAAGAIVALYYGVRGSYLLSAARESGVH
jgi:hypothetical protein